MFAISAGIIWVGFWPGLLPWFPILLLVLVFLGLARAVAGGFRGIAEMLVCAGLMLAGACWHLVYAGHRLEQQLPKHLERLDLLVQGYVASIPESRPAGQRFQFVLESTDGPLSSGRLLLNSYGDHHFKA
ncbi:MAG: DUF4131 domain-containing protein, partial [Gammaproteobacteria bacterium]|nr:DUF4131 domain-containing protein [Gammaproteobacteria bacterium]